METNTSPQHAAPTVEAVVRPWKRYEWIMAYVIKHGGVDVLNSNFVDDYAIATGAKISAVYWGANHCPMLGRDLAHMAKVGALKRGRIGLGYNWQPGFPKCVWSYTVGHASYLYESNPTGLRCAGLDAHKQDPVVQPPNPI